MKSSILTRISAMVLGATGTALLFAPDGILQLLHPEFPVSAYWLGQLLGATWIGVASLNWYSRTKVLGGIYGRPILLANLAIYQLAWYARSISPWSAPSAEATCCARRRSIFTAPPASV